MMQDSIHRHLVAMHDPEYAIRQARLLQQLGHKHRGRWIPFGGLEDEAVAASQRHRNHPERHHDGEVERRYARDDPERLTHRPAIDAAADLLRDLALQQMRDRYYVAQRVLKEEPTGGDDILRRISAAQIEGAVIGQVRALLRQPEIVAGGWLAARQGAPDLSEEDARDALARLDPLWEELSPAEQQSIIHALVDRVVVGPTVADIRLRVEGIGSLARDLGRGRAAP